MAALLTIMFLIIDPFTQQILQTVPCTREMPNIRPRISRSNVYWPDLVAPAHTGAQVDGDMAVAVLTGTMSPPADPNTLTSFDCQTGTCKFPELTTLAICHSCQDLTKSVITHKVSEGFNYTLPPDTASGFPGVAVNYFYALKTTVASSINNLLQLKVLMIPNEIDLDETNALPVSAVACQMWPCLRTIQSEVINSTLYQNETRRTRLGINQLYRGIADSNSIARFILAERKNVTVWQDGERQGEIACEGISDVHTQPSGTTYVATANIDSAPQEFPSMDVDQPDLLFPDPCVWSFADSTWQAVRSELEAQLGNLTISLFMDTFQEYQGPYVAQRLWRNGTGDFAHVDVFMRNLSDAMTASVRKRGTEGSREHAGGVVLMSYSCVSVSWVWIAYPAAMVGLAIMFLTLLVLYVPRNDMAKRGWKSSSLAVLLSTVDDTVFGAQEHVFSDLSRHQIEEIAGSVNAQLVYDVDGKATFM
jgi:hypothetical protein